MSEDTQMVNYEELAQMFLKKYKDLVIRLFQTLTDEETRRFQRLLLSNGFAREIYSTSQKQCHIYQNAVWQSIVMDTIDLNLIYENVDKMTAHGNDDSGNDAVYTDNLVKELLRYFKQDFFKWCDKPECENCHSTDKNKMKFIGPRQPTEEERKYDCGNTELYQCEECNGFTRFPRYGDPIKLLETRKGRCGEWCNLFTLILNSFGLRVRYVANKEDHVWCEYFSDNLNRWVHVDPCEQAFDEPFIYSKNWNKKMSYCISYERYGVTDVSKRYILQNQLPRNLISEEDLTFLCNYITKKLRQQACESKDIGNDEFYELFRIDEMERFELAGRDIDGDNTPVTKSETATTGNVGRKSGSAEWKAQRGEDGK